MPFATVNGIRLYYEWHGAEDGVPVVLTMGLGGDSTAWPFQLAALAPRHRVLVFDNRGAGRSDAPDTACTTRGMAEDLLALLDALGVERAHLLGLSLGGAIAQEAVLRRPRGSRASSSTRRGRDRTPTSRPSWAPSVPCASSSTGRASTAR